MLTVIILNNVDQKASVFDIFISVNITPAAGAGQGAKIETVRKAGAVAFQLLGCHQTRNHGHTVPNSLSFFGTPRSPVKIHTVPKSRSVFGTFHIFITVNIDPAAAMGVSKDVFTDFDARMSFKR